MSYAFLSFFYTFLLLLFLPPLQDLTHLNRPLSKVIIIDTEQQSVQLQPENSIILDKWKGDITDRTLWEIVPFLQSQCCSYMYL